MRRVGEEKRTVYCIGETLLDIIFRNGQVVASKPGGSMLNTAVSLGLSGVRVELITDFGKDAIGDLIADFLNLNGVSTTFAERFTDGKTALALALLDDHQNASYSFYKDFPSMRLNLVFPEIKKEDLVLFGSNYAITEGIRDKLKTNLLRARENGALMIYDPNFRAPHLPELPHVFTYILENILMSDLVRGSDEDFRHIFGSRDGMEAYARVLAAGCERLVYTRENLAEVFLPGNHWIFENEVVSPVSTIGAGDSFNAGVLYHLVMEGILREELVSLDEPAWALIVGTGAAFAKDVCLSYDNYISKPFIAQYENK